MFKFNKLFKKTAVGLMIQPHVISLLQLERWRSRIRISHQACLQLPQGAVADGYIERVDQVVACITQLVREVRLVRRDVWMAVPASWVMSQTIQLPAGLQGVRCYHAIAKNLQHYFPGVQDDLCFDYWQGPDDRMVLVAVRNEPLQSYLQVAMQAGLMVRGVDIDIYALMRAIQSLMPALRFVQVDSLLDLSGYYPRFVVLHQEQLIFYQQWDQLAILDSKNTILTALRHAWQLYGSIHPMISIQRMMILGSIEQDLDKAISAEFSVDVLCITMPDTISLPSMMSYGLALGGMQGCK